MEPTTEALGRILGQYMVMHVDDPERRQELVDIAVDANADMQRVHAILRSLAHDPDGQADKQFRLMHEFPHLQLPTPQGYDHAGCPPDCCWRP